MVSDWQPGDLALCVCGGVIHCPTPSGVFEHDGTGAPGEGALKTVCGLSPSLNYGGEPAICGCVDLLFTDGSRGTAKRFRKIEPHKPDAEDLRTIALLNGKPKVEA